MKKITQAVFLLAIVVLSTIPNSSHSQEIKSAVTAKTEEQLNQNEYHDITMQPPMPKIFKDKGGNKYELRFSYGLSHGVVGFEYVLALVGYKDWAGCDKLVHQKSKWDECMIAGEKYKKGKIINIFYGLGSGEYAVSAEMENLKGCTSATYKSITSQQYLIKDFNKDGYDDIGFRFVEIDCTTKKLTTYEKILIATKKGFELQEKILNN